MDCVLVFSTIVRRLVLKSTRKNKGRIKEEEEDGGDDDDDDKPIEKCVTTLLDRLVPIVDPFFVLWANSLSQNSDSYHSFSLSRSNPGCRLSLSCRCSSYWFPPFLCVCLLFKKKKKKKEKKGRIYFFKYLIISGAKI